MGTPSDLLAGGHPGAAAEPSPPSQYLASFLAIGVVTLLNLAIAGYVGYWGAAIPYLAAISILALFLGRGPVFLAALVSAASWDFIFISPRLTFLVKDPADALMLGLYFLLALTSGGLTQRLKSNERKLRARERGLEALSDLALSLAGANGTSAILEEGSEALARYFEAEVAIFMRDASGKLNPAPEGGWQPIDEATYAAATACDREGRPTGRGSGIKEGTSWHFAPLDSARSRLGVVGLRLAEHRRWSAALERFLATMLGSLALAVERGLALEQTTGARLAIESERLGKLLLDSVSHELRTPLTIIQGGASALADEKTAGNPTARRLFIAEIAQGVARLDALVDNLLSMNRLESGSLSLRLAEIDQDELVSAAIAQAGKEVDPRRLAIEEGAAPAVLRCDAALVVQVLVNLIRNAALHGAPEGPITLRYGTEAEGKVSFAVEDRGRGVPEADLGRIFDKFHRSPGAAPGGCGLGLAICRGLVEAHGGIIAARNLPQGGFSVAFTLPGLPPAPKPCGGDSSMRSPL